jgi:two-component system response regulator MtrA
VSRILIVEDNADLAFGLSRTLEAEGHEVAVAPDGPSGVREATAQRPELVILDLMLPGHDGYKVLQQIRSGGLEMPVLILTARGEEADKVHGFRLGADDYVTKPFSLSELVARVGALLRRARPSQPEALLFEFGDVKVDLGARVVTKGEKVVALTPREWDLLSAFIRHPRQVLARQLLLEQVWGFASDVTTRTIDIHVSELRRKLEDPDTSRGAGSSNEPRHFVTVWKTGYRFDP